MRVGEHDRGELRLVAGGNERAFLALVERHHPMLVRVASFWFEQQSDIEALVKQTWSSMLQRLDRFDDQSSLKGWLCVTLIKLARQRKGPEADESLQLEAAAQTLPAVDATRFSPAGDRWEGHWRNPPSAWPTHDAPLPVREVIAAALSALPRAERLIVVLRDSEGLSSLELQRALDLEATSQQRLLHSGRSRLRAALEDYYETRGARETT